MSPIAMTQHTGVRLAEIGFLLILFAGIWLAPRSFRYSNLPPRVR